MAITVAVRRRRINSNYSGLINLNYVYPVVADGSTTNYNIPVTHVEKDHYGDLTEHQMLVEFKTAFENQPSEVVLEVYRMEEQPDGTFKRQEIPFGYIDALQPLVGSFEILINSEFTPDLTDVFIKYKFEEF